MATNSADAAGQPPRKRQKRPGVGTRDKRRHNNDQLDPFKEGIDLRVGELGEGFVGRD